MGLLSWLRDFSRPPENSPEQLPVPLSWFKTRPYSHQIKSFLFGLEHPKAALLLPIGSGKSRTAIDILRYRIERGQVQRALVVAPLSVLSTWREEFEKHSDLVPVTIRGSREEKIVQLARKRKEPVIYLTNYETVRIYAKLFQNIQMVIADESTKIKSPHTKVSHTFWRIFEEVPYKLILTGLITENNVLDIYSQYKFLSPDVFGKSYQKFKDRYARWGGFHNYVYLGPKNIPELRRKLYSIGITFKREELFDLPERVYERREVELSGREKKAYKSMKENFLAQLASSNVVATNVLTQFLRLQQITSGFLSDSEGRISEIGDSKLKEFYDFMENEVKSESKTLVFVRFIRTLKKVQQWASEKGLNPVVIRGAVPEKSRGLVVERFQNDKKYRILICQIAAARYGLNLTAANLAVFLENSFSYGDRVQCEGRNYRLGQTQKVTVVDFIVPGSIDSYILKVLKKKKSLSDIVMRPQRLLRDGKEGRF